VPHHGPGGSIPATGQGHRSVDRMFVCPRSWSRCQARRIPRPRATSMPPGPVPPRPHGHRTSTGTHSCPPVRLTAGSPLPPRDAQCRYELSRAAGSRPAGQQATWSMRLPCWMQRPTPELGRRRIDRTGALPTPHDGGYRCARSVDVSAASSPRTLAARVRKRPPVPKRAGQPRAPARPRPAGWPSSIRT
jgi:hypothetical protein